MDKGVLRFVERCGFENLRVIKQPIAVQGTRPLHSAADAGEVAQCAE